MQPDTFFADHGLNVVYGGPPTRKTRALWAEAKRVCAQCPVIEQCGRDNLGEIEGVWGGLDPHQRQNLRKKHSAFVMAMEEGERKVEYAKLAHDLRQRNMPYRDVARIMGLNVKASQYLDEWYEGNVRVQEAPAPAVPVEVTVLRPEIEWPEGPPKQGDSWIYHTRTVVAAYYVGQTEDGEWFLMNAYLSKERSACWMKAEDVRIAKPVARTVLTRVGNESRIYGTVISPKQSRKAG